MPRTRSLPVLLVAALTPAVAAQQQLDELVPTSVGVSDWAGRSVALSAGRAILGAPLSDDLGFDAGSVHVFEEHPGGWVQVDELHAIGGSAGDQLGFSVAVQGLRVVAGSPYAEVGAPLSLIDAGAVVVFTKGIGGYAQTRLTASDAGAGDLFGYSLALDGDRLAVGAPEAAGSVGAVYVFEHDGVGWKQTARLLHPGGFAGDGFGWSVDLDGDRLIVGAPYDNDSGAAFLFAYSGAWNLTATLVDPLSPLDELSGWSVAVDGTLALVGAPGSNQWGTVDAYRDQGLFGGWRFDATLQAASLGPVDAFGRCLALEDGRAIVGAQHTGPGSSQGAAYVFTRESSVWYERGILLGDQPTGNLGSDVALLGDLALVGDSHGDSAAGDGGEALLFDVNTVSTTGCLGLNPAGSLTELAGLPALGTVWTLGVHNPVGTQLPGSQALLAISPLKPFVTECGATIPGWGMSAAGAAGELLIATVPTPIVVGPVAWTGAPASISVAVPSQPALAGAKVYLQGLLLGAPGSAVTIGLTEGMVATLAASVP